MQKRREVKKKHSLDLLPEWVHGRVRHDFQLKKRREEKGRLDKSPDRVIGLIRRLYLKFPTKKRTQRLDMSPNRVTDQVRRLCPNSSSDEETLTRHVTRSGDLSGKKAATRILTWAHSFRLFSIFFLCLFPLLV